MSIFIFEIIFSINFKNLKSRDKNIIAYENFKFETTILGNQLKPGIYEHSYKEKENFIYNIKYKINKNNFRENRYFKKDNNLNLEEVAFFGSSHVFGWGLDDNETLPYLFKKQNINYYVYNFGINGGAINQTLHLINKKPDFLKKYNIIETGPYQLGRVSCDRDYSFNVPIFEFKNETLQHTGYCNFINLNFQLPRILGSIINRSKLNQRISRIISREKHEDTLKIYLHIIKKINIISNNNSKNLIIGYVGNNTEMDRRITKFFGENNIKFVDITLDKSDKFKIKYDGHPNKLANEIRADLLSKYIKALE